MWMLCLTGRRAEQMASTDGDELEAVSDPAVGATVCFPLLFSWHIGHRQLGVVVV
jgi:hypothetical protein